MAEITGGVESVRAAITKANSTTISTAVVSETTQDRQEHDAAEPKKTSWWRRLVGLIWDSVEGDPRDRRYVQKVDTFLLYALVISWSWRQRLTESIV